MQKLTKSMTGNSNLLYPTTREHQRIPQQVIHKIIHVGREMYLYLQIKNK